MRARIAGRGGLARHEARSRCSLAAASRSPAARGKATDASREQRPGRARRRRRRRPARRPTARRAACGSPPRGSSSSRTGRPPTSSGRSSSAGSSEAQRQSGAAVSYRAPDSFSIERMRRFIDEAVADRPGRAGRLAARTRRRSRRRSRPRCKAGIPVVTINSGSDEFRKLGVLAHVGQPEYEAGVEAGERMGRAGVKRALCVNQESGNSGLDERCRGFADGLRRVGGSVALAAGPAAGRAASPQRRMAEAIASGPGRRHPHARPGRRDAGAGRRARERPRVARQARHLRPLARRAGRGARRRDAVRGRPAAVPAGLPAGDAAGRAGALRASSPAAAS